MGDGLTNLTDPSSLFDTTFQNTSAIDALSDILAEVCTFNEHGTNKFGSMIHCDPSSLPLSWFVHVYCLAHVFDKCSSALISVLKYNLILGSRYQYNGRVCCWSYKWWNHSPTPCVRCRVGSNCNWNRYLCSRKQNWRSSNLYSSFKCCRLFPNIIQINSSFFNAANMRNLIKKYLRSTLWVSIFSAIFAKSKIKILRNCLSSSHYPL